VTVTGVKRCRDAKATDLKLVCCAEFSLSTSGYQKKTQRLLILDDELMEIVLYRREKTGLQYPSDRLYLR